MGQKSKQEAQTVKEEKDGTKVNLVDRIYKLVYRIQQKKHRTEKSDKK